LGTDTYDLSRTTAGATVNLGLGASTSADTGTDTLTAVENVIGSSGDDIFVASVGDGNNSYNGGSGIDTYDLSGTAANAVVNLNQGTASSLDIGADTLTLNTIENVTGGAGNDSIAGNSQNNVLIGGAGNDTLNGNAGADTMLGGAGNDAYVVDNAGDAVTEAVGQGADTVFAMVSYALAAGSEVETLRANVVTGLTLTGNEFNNTIIGNAGNDTLIGGAGNDVLNGNVGTDTMVGGTGNDTYFVDNAGDVVTEAVVAGSIDDVFTTVSYTLAAGSEIESLRANVGTALTLTGNEFNNTVVGNAGNDTLFGGAGNDILNGIGGADTMVGGTGNDT
jgi:Ca2+-binding RTX toxin-like protein